MVTLRSVLGRHGEDRAARHLESLGYEVLERNYHCRQGEIDIVAREGGDLAFIEVKSRRSDADGAASESVTRRKRGRIVKAALAYLSERSLGEVGCRFDVAEVYFINGKPVTVEVIKGAFSADDGG
ncbi:MAG: YraN family protein [Armatimonadetes bacterium]|nr:YraN family protein [Armatimonadota bacterium]